MQRSKESGASLNRPEALHIRLEGDASWRVMGLALPCFPVPNGQPQRPDGLREPRSNHITMRKGCTLARYAASSHDYQPIAGLEHWSAESKSSSTDNRFSIQLPHSWLLKLLD